MGPPPVPRVLPLLRAHPRGGEVLGRRRHPPRLRLPQRERGVRPGLRGSRHRSSSGRPRRRWTRWARRPAPAPTWRRPGVPVVPGSTAPFPSATEARAYAEKIGFPVMLKAAGGGGGKGMRRVERGADFDSAWRAAQSEALNAFGNDAVYLEKYLDEPHHVEIQVFADQAGEHRPSERARVLGPAAPPEGHRGNSLAHPQPRDARGHGRGCRARGEGGGLRRGGHRRVPRRQAPELLLPGDEHPAPGRAPGDRVGHRSRSGGVADPRRARRAARLPDRVAARARHRGARLRRGPGTELHAQPRPHHLPARARRDRTCATTRACTRATRCRRSTTR